MLKIFLLFVLLYLLMTIVTAGLWVYDARITGEDAESVYADDDYYPLYFIIGLFFPITLPMFVIKYAWKYIKIFMIIIVESAVASKKRGEK